MIGCNLSNVKTLETSMQEVSFSDCKILGVHFQKCNNFLFEVTFEKCILDFSVFSGLSLTKSIFRDSELRGVDFS
jgi:fluoroquinolone resistance protein